MYGIWIRNLTDDMRGTFIQSIFFEKV